MEAKYEDRKQELLDECDIAPEVFEQVMPRLEKFMKPFVESLVRKEQVAHASTFVQGLLSDLQHKNTESIAYRFGQGRMGLQWFMGVSAWDHEPLRDELVRQVGETLGDDNGVIVFDPSGFSKKGTESVGVKRQWCGRLGKTDNCQVAVCMGYVSRHEHALVDTRLYLPKEWATDKQRRKKGGVPKEVRFRTRHRLCLEMLAQHGHEEVLVVIRYKDRDDRRVVKTDYYLSNASVDTTEAEFARAAKAEHRIEECIQRAKSEAGLADYEVRNWRGWHHHQILSLIATWFLIQEARRGKKIDSGDHGSTNSRRHQRHPKTQLRMRYSLSDGPRTTATPHPQRTHPPLPLETA